MAVGGKDWRKCGDRHGCILGERPCRPVTLSAHFAARAGHRGIKAARAQYDAGRTIVERAQWKRPEDVRKAHPKASVLKGSRVVFNIKGNDYRLIAVAQYTNGVLLIRLF